MRPRLGSFRTPVGERLVEWGIAFVATTAILAVLLLFAFVLREALPLLLGGTPLRLGDLLAPQTDAPDAPAHVWQPVGYPPKFNVVPLVFGTLKLTVVTMCIAAPPALLAAIYTAEIASERIRAWVKPTVEVLAGIPSVVLGFFGLAFFASVAQWATGATYRLNTLAAALALGLAITPVVFTVADDAIRAVPATLREASFALGARRWQTIVRVTVPAALPGIVAAFVLGFGRSIGETMIVLMVSGNAPVLDASPLASARTMTATIASELGETPRGADHWRVLFFLGALLFLITLVLDTVGRLFVSRLQRRLDPSAGTT